MRNRFNMVQVENETKTRTTVFITDTEYPNERIDLGVQTKGDSGDKLTRMHSRAEIIIRALNSEAKVVKR